MHYIVFLILLVIPFTVAQAKTIHFVLSKDEPIYQQAHQKIQSEFNQSSALVLKQDKQVIDTFSTESIHATDLIITIGNKAAIEIDRLGLKNPIIFSFVDDSLIAHLENRNNKRWVAIPINQPVKHLISVAEQLIEESYKNKILVVISEANQALLTELNAIKKLKNSLEIIKIPTGELAAKEIEKYLFDGAVLVAVHDKDIWTGNSAKWLLQQAFIHKVPVIGYSKKFLVAGALVSVYSPLDAITSESAMLINNWSNTGELDRHGVIYPKAQIDINSNIARSLHYPISKTDSLSINE